MTGWSLGVTKGIHCVYCAEGLWNVEITFSFSFFRMPCLYKNLAASFEDGTVQESDFQLG